MFSTFNRLTPLFIDATIVRPRLDKLYLDRIDQVRPSLGEPFMTLLLSVV